MMAEKSFFRIGLYLLLAAAGIWLGLKFLLPAVLPFVLGLAVALLLEPPVRLCQRKTPLPRWCCTGACLTAFYVLLGLGLWLLVRQLCTELAALSQDLPGILMGLAEPMRQLKARLTELAARLPDGFGTAAETYINSFFENGTVLTQKLPELAFSAAGAIVAAVPDAVVFLLTAVLSSFFISSDLPHLKQICRKLPPPKWREKILTAAGSLKKAMGGWFKAQLKLMGCTFVILTLGLMLLGQDAPLLVGGLIAVIDALPVFGTGTVLIPWGLLRFVQGDMRGGISLLILYGVAALVRTVLEPKLVGKQMGLSPLLTLGAIYVGYRLLGILGMLAFPVAVMVLKQFWDQLRGELHPPAK